MPEHPTNDRVSDAGNERHPAKEDRGDRRLRHNTIRFVSITVLCLAVLFSVGEIQLVRKEFTEPYVLFVTSCSRHILALLGVDVAGTGNQIISAGFVAYIIDICSGLGVMAVFLAVILAFPAPWKNKFVGIVVGLPALFLVNQIRIVALFLLGYKRFAILDTAHYYFSQAFVIFVTIALWLLWVATLPRNDIKRS